MKNFDLIVVGSGIMGAFHAYHAAKKGKKVLIIEKDNFPVSATVRNFGQAVPSGSAGKWFDYGRRSLEIYKDIQQQFDISVRKNGTIYIASDDTEWQLANELFDIHQRQGYECSLLSKRQCLDLYPELKQDYVRGAIYYPNEVSVEPNLLIYRIIQYLQEQLGVTYLNNTSVINCTDISGKVVVTTAGSQLYSADKAIICSGYVFNLLFPEIYAQSGMVVSKLQMLQTVPLANVSIKGNILTGLSIRRYESFEQCPSFKNITTPEHYSELKKWGIHILFKQAIDGSVIIGDSHEYAPVGRTDELGFDTQNHINELMLKEAERIMSFPVRKIARAWAGFYAQHPNDIFEFDISPNIHIRTGIGGKGMTTSAGYAENMIASLL
ncbi:TIGR03364 family FAD-dependent oxidoreductase [Emticicia sp. TH156]|uniref:TIGR03364 family FAD-dependent oxidoreductase n=1 Tax=Emticicia sp. TH156 TaxID=2067454 RepID=UPI000C76124C|nr:TIGR03364 family FAD-dependent oxidoreductase [Emticicia sp. TH156]PLK43886.1 TIGR03364 family FAD-dependent oxidoreductase [Emticicia sp. TH156]